MIKIFYGEDRLAISEAVVQELGSGYEVFEGEKLLPADLPSIFQGTTLFGGGGERRILLKDLGENTAVWEKIEEYFDTEHRVVIWETKLDKRTAGYKKMKSSGVEIREFAIRAKTDARSVFGLLEMALRDGEAAIKLVESIKLEQDPYMLVGLLVTQTLKRLEAAEKRGNSVKEKKILASLAALDLKMKSSSLDPWVLIETFLLSLKG